MTVVVNGETRELADGVTVAEIVGMLVDSERGVAVALDGDVVPRSAWPTTAVDSGQRVEILTAVQGG